MAKARSAPDPVPAIEPEPLNPRLLLLSRNNTVLAETRGFLRNLATQMFGLSTPIDPQSAIGKVLHSIEEVEEQNQQAILAYFKEQK